jgi:hypothetical protein
MKKMILITVMLVLSLGILTTSAAKWRVNNTGIQADFITAQEAASSPQVVNGDTIYFEGSTWPYGNVTVNKRLVIIGPGYFLGENDSTQADKKAARVGTITLAGGSDGSVVKGMYIESYLTINSTSDVTAERNYCNALDINYNCVKLVIIRNYINSIAASSCNHVLISNNIISYDGAWGLTISNSGSAIIANNVIKGYININNSVFKNNISLMTNPGGFVTANVTSESNIGAGTQFGTSSGNQSNVDMNAVFTFTGSTDGKYTLKAGSPAIGAGTGGTDCGIFGGDYPYVLSGMVTGPSVYYLNMDGIDVTVKAKSH